MRADDRAIEDGADIIVVDAKRPEDVVPPVLVRPAVESIVDRFPRSKSLGQVAPRCAGLRDPHDRIDEVAIAPLGLSAVRVRKMRGYRPPLLVGQLVTSHPTA